MTKIILSFFFCFTANFSFAADLEALYGQLKNVDVNYGPEGVVCEQVARLEMYERFPQEKYEIAVGVEYNLGGRTLGELDMVVLDKETNKVVLVGEVKCWKSFKDGLDKAKTQRELFTWVLMNNPSTVNFVSHEGLSFGPQEFVENKNYATISQKGGVKYGYNYELQLTLEELKALRARLLKN